MPHYQDTIDRNPGFPPRSPSPPQFPEYSLWGNSDNSSYSKCTNMHAPAPQVPLRHIYPTRVADDGPKPYYHSADDHSKSPHIQRDDWRAWPPPMPDREEQRSMTFQSPGEYTRSPNQFTEEQPLRIRPQLWHNLSQYDERFSVSPRRPDDYCMSSFQPAVQFSKEPQPLMSIRMQHPRYLSPSGISDEYRRSPFQPSGQHGQDAHKFLMRTEHPQHKFPLSDEHIRSPFPAYNTFMRYHEDAQPLMLQSQSYRLQSPLQRHDDYTRSSFPASKEMHNSSRFYDKDCLQPLMPQSQSYRLRSPLQRHDDYTRSSFPASKEMHNSSRFYDEDCLQPLMPQSQSYRHLSPLQRPEHTRSPFPAPKRHNSSRNDEEDCSQPLMPQTQPFMLPSPLQRPNYERSQFQPSEQQYNSMHHSEGPSHAKSSPESQLQSNMQFAEDKTNILIPHKKRTDAVLQSEWDLIHTGVQEPSNNMVPSKPSGDIVIEDEPKPVLAEIEDQEIEVLVIERKSLYLHPDNFQFGDEIDEPSPEPQASTSSGSSGEWTSNIFKREGSPSSQSHILSSRVQPQGQRSNSLNTRLVKALSQPVKMEKGAKMMQRMGWIGGGLGKDGTGIVDPIAPNAIYATTTAGFGQEILTIQRLPTKRENRSPCIKRKKNKKMQKNLFKMNVLLNLLKFATNDMQVELYFEPRLLSCERKRIHKIVEALGNNDMDINFDEHIRIVKDIRRRCRFTLNTQSYGEGTQRKICVFKEPPDNMFLVTPGDCRPCLTDIIMQEDEPNPFLKSIKKHIKEPESASPVPVYLIDKLVEFFLEFCEVEAFTEYRFLGPFTQREIVVINAFLALIEDLSNKAKPDYMVPIELLDVFSGEFTYRTDTDTNGFAYIKKIHFSMKEEYMKLLEKERDERRARRHPINYRPERFAWRTKELYSVD